MTQNQSLLIVFLLMICGGFIYLLSPILAPFVLGVGIAYMADPFVDKLEARGHSRTMSVVYVCLVVLIFMVLALVVLLPILIKQMSSLLELLPVIVTWVSQSLLPFLSQTFNISIDAMEIEQFAQYFSSDWQKAGGIAKEVIQYLTSSTMEIFGALGNAAMVPVVSFYLLRDFDVLTASIRDILPKNIEPKVTLWASECNDVLSAFVRGQLLVMLALGLIYGFGLTLTGLDYALLIGLLAGLASVIPYLGFAVGIVVALVVALFQFDSYWGMLGVVAVFSIGQLLESTVLTPLLIGDRIGLHPVAVIFAVLAGAQLFGFTGMLLALPVAAVIMVLLRHLNKSYRSSSLYDQ